MEERTAWCKEMNDQFCQLSVNDNAKYPTMSRPMKKENDLLWKWSKGNEEKPLKEENSGRIMEGEVYREGEEVRGLKKHWC